MTCGKEIFIRKSEFDTCLAELMDARAAIVLYEGAVADLEQQLKKSQAFVSEANANLLVIGEQSQKRITQLELLLKEARTKLDTSVCEGILAGPDRILAAKIDEAFGQVRYG